jgi:hypothetical protein
MNIKTARVSTCSHPFFIPAQRMYVACGFIETGRRPLEQDPSFEFIDYVMPLDNQRVREDQI